MHNIHAYFFTFISFNFAATVDKHTAKKAVQQLILSDSLLFNVFKSIGKFVDCNHKLNYVMITIMIPKAGQYYTYKLMVFPRIFAFKWFAIKFLWKINNNRKIIKETKFLYLKIVTQRWRLCNIFKIALKLVQGIHIYLFSFLTCWHIHFPRLLNIKIAISSEYVSWK